MLSEIVSPNPEAPVMVIFGGSPIRRAEVLNLIKSIDADITAYGVLSQEEGLQLLQSLPLVSLVLIGGRYTEDQRFAIKQFIADKLPHTAVTEPGWAYTYNDENIKKDLTKKLAEKMIIRNINNKTK
ncbi:MAG: hypothetical protein H7Y86_02140 [Rhizobacter sp.]|nr:hypothetical protein [Ferruginibacter sp.]